MPRPKTQRRSRPWFGRNMLRTTAQPGYHPKFVVDDPANIERHLELGYEMVQDVTGARTEHELPERPGDGARLTSVRRYREMVLMQLPDELKAERDEALRERTDRQTIGIVEQMKRDAAKAAPRGAPGVTPKLVIE